MKIIAVSTMKDEPNAALPIEHLRRQGIDAFCISAEDIPTRDIILDLTGSVELPPEPFDQGAEITRLARRAMHLGADWIIPFDADEYWCAAPEWSHLTVRDILATCADYDAIFAPMLLHITPEERAINAKPLPKVCFRPNDDMTVAWGSHMVTGFTSAYMGPLVLRELQYASWFHFLAKIEKARQLHSQPHMATHEYGSHMWRLCQMSEPELRAEWDAHLATETIHDPIPGLVTT